MFFRNNVAGEPSAQAERLLGLGIADATAMRANDEDLPDPGRSADDRERHDRSHL